MFFLCWTPQAKRALKSERSSNHRQGSLRGKTVKIQLSRTTLTIWSGDERSNEMSLRMINISTLDSLAREGNRSNAFSGRGDLLDLVISAEMILPRSQNHH